MTGGVGITGTKYLGKPGTDNYEELSNKPQINGVELEGNKSFQDLGLDYVNTEKFNELDNKVTETDNKISSLDTKVKNIDEKIVTDVATASSNGLMSSTDKIVLTNIKNNYASTSYVTQAITGALEGSY